jgi:hypothetical protein
MSVRAAKDVFGSPSCPNVIHLRTATADGTWGQGCAVAIGDSAPPLEFCHRVRNIYCPPKFMAFHRERLL